MICIMMTIQMIPLGNFKDQALFCMVSNEPGKCNSYYIYSRIQDTTKPMNPTDSARDIKKTHIPIPDQIARSSVFLSNYTPTPKGL